jgi:hypothetical protein
MWELKKDGQADKVAVWRTITGHAAYPTYDAMPTPNIQKGS